MFALVDCNSFYASCEKIFRPDLESKPVIVLSNNDGCIIARSKEAKELGIPMGGPAFKHRDLIEKNGVVVFSSNFALYGDISDRVMKLLSSFAPDMEVYSIDEAFLWVSDETDFEKLGEQIRHTVLTQIGVPVSVGFGKTKTLAKLANHLAKKSPTGVVNIHACEMEAVFKCCSISEVWGVGRQHTKALAKMNVHTIYDFLQLDPAVVLKRMSVVGLRHYKELKSEPCLRLEHDIKDRKSILSSRSFGKKVTTITGLQGGISNNVVTACRKLRQQRLVAKSALVFVGTSRHGDEYYAKSVKVVFDSPTDYEVDILQKAFEGLDRIYLPNKKYAKSGILLMELSSKSSIQPSLFMPGGPLQSKKITALTSAIDTLNAKWGKHSLLPASFYLGCQEWKMNQQHRSPRYTADWNELPTAYCK